MSITTFPENLRNDCFCYQIWNDEYYKGCQVHIGYGCRVNGIDYGPFETGVEAIRKFREVNTRND